MFLIVVMLAALLLETLAFRLTVFLLESLALRLVVLLLAAERTAGCITTLIDLVFELATGQTARRIAFPSLALI